MSRLSLGSNSGDADRSVYELKKYSGLSAVPERFFSCPDVHLADALRKKPFLLAPMAGVSDASYRTICRWGGASLAYSEMVSVAGLHYAGASWELTEPALDEPDVAVQLFGHNPELFYEAAVRLKERLGDRLAYLDINMACPVPKVTKKGEGAALMADPLLAAAIVEACRRGALATPVTVKIRRGLHPGSDTATSFARVLEDSGAEAIAIHGRYASQGYRGESSRDALMSVVGSVQIPVIASGDIFCAKDAVDALKTTGCAGVMIARGSYGNPWIFSQAQRLMSGEEVFCPTAEQKVMAFMLHVRLLGAYGVNPHVARRLATWYLKGFPDARSLRRSCMCFDRYEEFLSLAERILNEPSKLSGMDF